MISTTEVVKNLQVVKSNVKKVLEKSKYNQNVTLVAVSKTKPAELIQACYDEEKHLHFGENYVKELCDKAPVLPKQINWHFIGHLQSNKVKQICEIPNLFLVETVDREKIAQALNKAMESQKRKLNIMVQVNTSGEDNKSGIEPSKCVAFVKHIQEKCEYLNFYGLMTIGSVDNSKSASETEKQPDFECLLKCKENVSKELNIKGDDIKLSMGMSSDYLVAIEYGSNNVRVGSSIFGARSYKDKQ